MNAIFYNLLAIAWVLIIFRMWYVLWADTNTTKDYKIKWTILILIFGWFGAIAYSLSDKTHQPILPWSKKH
ncbi:MAG: hypothetical protein Q7S39_09700 [Ignavibacteria bacterium]|nr:hypothetical protein [Ignavibacteria bacterium]